MMTIVFSVLLVICITVTCVKTLLEDDGMPFDGESVSTDTDSTIKWSDDNIKTMSDADEWTADEIDDITGWSEYTHPDEGCSDGKCKFCFELWKFTGCFVAEIIGKGICIAFQVGDKTMYNTTTDKSMFTIGIGSQKFPSSIAKWMKSDLLIKVTDLNINAKSLCFQVEMNIKWVGMIKWPKYSPKCFTL